MAAAVGIVLLIGWASSILRRWNSKGGATAAVVGLLLLLVVVVPAITAYASAPHYALYSNVIGDRYTAHFFPHDEFYDDGLREAIQFVCADAPANATMVTETPGVARYYLAKCGRTDLQSRVLSDGGFTVPGQAPAYFILQRGRTYFENQEKMRQVRERFPLVYASCVRSHTAAEVFSAQPGAAAITSPCADAQR
jgi:hypothetical protein